MYLERWRHMKLLPSRRVLCTPYCAYNHAPCHFMQSHIRKVYACLAVTCHLHFWQNDRGLLRATAVTRGWNGYRNKSQHRKLTLEKKILPPLSPKRGHGCRMSPWVVIWFPFPISCFFCLVLLLCLSCHFYANGPFSWLISRKLSNILC